MNEETQENAVEPAVMSIEEAKILLKHYNRERRSKFVSGLFTIAVVVLFWYNVYQGFANTKEINLLKTQIEQLQASSETLAAEEFK